MNKQTNKQKGSQEDVPRTAGSPTTYSKEMKVSRR
jgi:hypothetical protein